MKIIVIGGGAAGFFAALSAKKHQPKAEVIILEKSKKLLSKVRISGGGRCNVTHSCFDPKQLITNYPRGARELLGPFHRFQPSDTIAWFEERGVRLKTEEDGRMFPVTDSSETIIDCLLDEARKIGVEIRTGIKIQGIEKNGEEFHLNTDAAPFIADKVILATGSAPQGWEFAKSLGHEIVPPVPSLFTFNIPDFPLAELSGVSVSQAKIKITGSRLEETGPLLITHWGFSGPGALKLSAFGARILREREYSTEISIDWVPGIHEETLKEIKQKHPHVQLGNVRDLPLPKRLWKKLCERFQLSTDTPLCSLGKKAINTLAGRLKDDRYAVRGKTTNKEEFVTCGGIKLGEVDFKSMESKKIKNLYFCGEVLDIDGITGGFNFQNAWTTGWIAGRAAVGG